MEQACGHLFLSPLFDLVKCLLILLWRPFSCIIQYRWAGDHALLSSFLGVVLLRFSSSLLIRPESHVAWRRGGTLK